MGDRARPFVFREEAMGTTITMNMPFPLELPEPIEGRE